MTVLVGIKCQDGVVIGSDSSATFGPWVGAATIEQPTRKIDLIEGGMVLAGTGQIGLGQRFCALLTAMHKDNGQNGYKGRSAVEAAKMMCAGGINDFASTKAPAREYGALVAFATRKELHLCEFGIADMQPELKTEHLWYASMGSGQAIADPFLALMRKVFWKNEMPNLAAGIFASVWTLKHTIDVNPGGVNGPIHIATLTWQDANTKEKAVASFLDEDQIAQHLESVASAERHLAGFRNVIGGAAVEAAPDVPVPPPAV